MSRLQRIGTYALIVIAALLGASAALADNISAAIAWIVYLTLLHSYVQALPKAEQ